jgi:lipopolysaccharide/colanic/teichoic acid biosynthesis glycosyltransferase
MSMLRKPGASGYLASVDEFAGAMLPPAIGAATVKAPLINAKRLMDLFGASLALLIAAPVMAMIYIALVFAGGQPIFVQYRVGQNGRLFPCCKFRSMVKNANRILTDHLASNSAAREEWSRNFKLANDPRVTTFGRFLRRASLDELPQLFNVLRGDMSLVGPRPIVPSEVELYSDNIAAYYSCRPGITGLWQVSGRNMVGYDKRVHLDVFYAGKQSLGLDLIILVRTVRVVLSGRGAC